MLGEVSHTRNMDPLTVATSKLDELISRLTPRQLQIVELLARGKTTREVCTILSIERITLQLHIRQACYRTETESRTQLIVLFALWKVLNNGEQRNLHSETE